LCFGKKSGPRENVNTVYKDSQPTRFKAPLGPPFQASPAPAFFAPSLAPRPPPRPQSREEPGPEKASSPKNSAVPRARPPPHQPPPPPPPGASLTPLGPPPPPLFKTKTKNPKRGYCSRFFWPLESEPLLEESLGARPPPPPLYLGNVVPPRSPPPMLACPLEMDSFFPEKKFVPLEGCGVGPALPPPRCFPDPAPPRFFIFCLNLQGNSCPKAPTNGLPRRSANSPAGEHLFPGFIGGFPKKSPVSTAGPKPGLGGGPPPPPLRSSKMALPFFTAAPETFGPKNRKSPVFVFQKKVALRPHHGPRAPPRFSPPPVFFVFLPPLNHSGPPPVFCPFHPQKSLGFGGEPWGPGVGPLLGLP